MVTPYKIQQNENKSFSILKNEWAEIYFCLCAKIRNYYCRLFIALIHHNSQAIQNMAHPHHIRKTFPQISAHNSPGISTSNRLTPNINSGSIDPIRHLAESLLKQRQTATKRRKQFKPSETDWHHFKAITKVEPVATIIELFKDSKVQIMPSETDWTHNDHGLYLSYHFLAIVFFVFMGIMAVCAPFGLCKCLRQSKRKKKRGKHSRKGVNV